LDATDEVHAEITYFKFDQALEPDVVMRQEGIEEIATAFRDALTHLRVSISRPKDCGLLYTQIRASLP
jgi:hypothetical protein